MNLSLKNTQIYRDFS